MDRRNFLQGIAATAAGLELLSSTGLASANDEPEAQEHGTRKSAAHENISVDGFTLVAEFKDQSASWKVYEDFRTRDGSIAFVASTGAARLLTKSAEASMPEGTPYLGLQLKDIGLSSPDLLADQLLKMGDPDPEAVRSAAPPMNSSEKNSRHWTTFIGNKEAYDVTPVYHSGSTKTYHPIQYSSRLRDALKEEKLYDGLVGGFMPAVRKVIPISGNAYWEIIVFGDTGPNKNKYIVHTWCASRVHLQLISPNIPVIHIHRSSFQLSNHRPTAMDPSRRRIDVVLYTQADIGRTQVYAWGN